ncbi:MULTISPECIES: FecCD family ABC transporter permease [Ramlibacter]|uniref:Iron chelate uptake ABC transporter family permease subunit n=1 Tax=Ramlibacter pinisoli TaxID=2682844 RepID=A0A6N8IWR1_9BURK|nr:MULTISPECIES: iron ABC transporter permease [Ramlibacter]MBA2961470.1 iron ABC transporter permease [Ramlibacter sp. CGMCC 1.13660]MVQ31414.1 iron chelate uptake ABC transporter family permease subunit [Ramlibacter pinisoli]
MTARGTDPGSPSPLSLSRGEGARGGLTSGGLGLLLVAATLLLLALGTAVGSLGWEPLWSQAEAASTIVWDIRLPRSLGAWLAGALLGLAGAVAQGLFRNPLADPYLMGSATGAAFGVAVLLVAMGASPGAASGWAAQFGLAGAGFAGAVLAVLVTLGLARGVQHTLRLLLAGVIVGVVFGALAALVMFWAPEVMRAMQAFLLGTTAFLGWDGTGLLALVLALVLPLVVAWSPALDALALGEATALSLGIPLRSVRVLLVAGIALATGAAVAQVGLIAFVGLVAPHLVRAAVRPTHRGLLPLAALSGGLLLLAADVLSRWLLAPRELPVGVLTALLGGAYLLWLMHRRPP